MALPVAADTSRISDSLALRYMQKPVGSFFADETDAFMLHLTEEAAVSDAGGRGFVVQVKGTGNIKTSPNLASAGGRAAYDQFVITAPIENWRATWTLEAFLQAQTKGMANAYDLAKETIDMHMRVCRENLGTYIGGKGWGSLAGIQAVTTGVGGTITLGHPDGTSATAVPELTNRFKIGMTLRAADLEHTGAVRAGTDPTITAINYSTGVLTFDDVPVAFAVGDYLSESGCRAASPASVTRLKPVGLEGWLDPVAAISGDTLGTGSDTRFNRPDLQPLRYDCAGKTPEDALIELDAFAHTQGKPRKGLKIFVSTQTKATLSKNAHASKTVALTVEKKNDKGQVVKIGYSAFMLDGQGSEPIEVIGSSKIRPGLAFYGPFGDKEMGFKLLYSGPQIINVTTQGNNQLFQLAQDGVVDGDGNTVQGFIAQGFARVAVKCGHPNNYVVGLNVGF